MQALRIAALTAFFEQLRALGATLCILTSGETAALHMLFEQQIVPWAALFAAPGGAAHLGGSGGWIANTVDEFFVTDATGEMPAPPH